MAPLVTGHWEEPPRRLRAASAFLGSISYPLYMLHVPFFSALLWILGRFGIVEFGLLHASVAVVTLSLLCWISLSYYEAPVTAFLDGLDVKIEKPDPSPGVFDVIVERRRSERKSRHLET
jgi:peptidoglycan/LPS O-acetylase OafA/YrhL